MLSAFANSLIVAAGATLLSTCMALLIASALFQRKSAFKSLAEALFLLPLVTPPTVLGYWLLTLVSRDSLIGSAFESVVGFPIVFTRVGAVLAASITAFPLVFQATSTALESVDSSLIDVAQTLGAKRLGVLRRVALPLAAPGILSGIVLAFARALGEFGATLMVAGNLPGRTQTASLALFDSIQSGDSHRALVIALWLSCLSVGFLMLGQFLKTRKRRYV
jgi:molybdate transport system permease protein